MKESIESVLTLYHSVLNYQSSTYGKRVGIFNQLVEKFIRNLSLEPQKTIFEYNIKFGFKLLTESISNTSVLTPQQITEWIIEKIDNGELILKEKFKDNNVQFNLNEQYAQSTLDDRAYYYTRQGKLVQGKKNAPDGVEAKYIYPDLYNGKPTDPNAVPKDPKGLPRDIPPSAVDQGFQSKKYYDSETQTKEYQKSQGISISKIAWIDKNVRPYCKTAKDSNGNPASYLTFNLPPNSLGQGSKGENNLRFMCHDNYCNTFRDKLTDPEGKKCKNNTITAKIQEMGWDGFFQTIREAMTSAAGAAAQIIVDIFGGGVAVEIIWGVLLAYDAYQALQGNFNIINILVDIAGIVTFGPGGKFLWDKFSGIAVESISTSKAFAAWLEKSPKVVEFFSKFNFEAIYKGTLGKIVAFLEKSPMFSSLTQSIKQVWGMVFEYVEVLSGKTAAEAAEKGTEKYLTKKTGKEFENVATKGMNYVQPGLGTAAKVVDKTSKVVKAVSALSK